MLWCIAGGVPSLVQPGKMVLISMLESAEFSAILAQSDVGCNAR